MSTLRNDNTLILAALLVGGAYMYSRKVQAQPMTQAQGQAYRQPQGSGSMPATVGTGVAQVLGGVLGSLWSSMTSAPKTKTTDFNPNPLWQGDVVLQDSAGAALDDVFYSGNSGFDIPSLDSLFAKSGNFYD